MRLATFLASTIERSGAVCAEPPQCFHLYTLTHLC
jgi:2-C-methyl-D-erythritol 4-phosphate cytidylyltransferase